MFEFIKFLQKRPSDNTIVAIRIIFWLILIIVLYYNFFGQTPPARDEIENKILFWNVDTNWIKDYFKYAIIALWFFPLLFWILGIFKIPVAHKKYIKIWQIALWILLWYSASIVVNQPHLDINELLIFAWFLPFFAWLTWKMIASYGLKYWEKIKKIRV